MGGWRVRNGWPLDTSQIRIVLSSETVISSLPSGVNRTLRIMAVCPPASSTRMGVGSSAPTATGGKAADATSAIMQKPIRQGRSRNMGHLKPVAKDWMAICGDCQNQMRQQSGTRFSASRPGQGEGLNGGKAGHGMLGLSRQLDHAVGHVGDQLGGEHFAVLVHVRQAVQGLDQSRGEVPLA